MIEEEKIETAITELVNAYGKPHATFVATGMAAIELALTALNIVPGDRVLVPVEACFSVAASVLRVGAHPVFVDVGRTLLLTPEDLPDGIQFHAVIAVHAFGLPCNIVALRKCISPQVPIIEDVSLAFGLQQSVAKPGSGADIVVSSLGSGKSVDIGEGGVVLSEREDIACLLDRRSPESRVREHPPLPYALSPAALLMLPVAIQAAKVNIRARREAVASITPRLKAYGFEIWSPAPGDVPCWHRLPVWVPPAMRQTAMAANLIAGGEVAQLPHEVDVPDLPMFVGRSSRVGNGDRRDIEHLLLLRTDNVQRLNRWLNGLAHLRES